MKVGIKRKKRSDVEIKGRATRPQSVLYRKVEPHQWEHDDMWNSYLKIKSTEKKRREFQREGKWNLSVVKICIRLWLNF